MRKKIVAGLASLLVASFLTTAAEAQTITYGNVGTWDGNWFGDFGIPVQQGVGVIAPYAAIGGQTFQLQSAATLNSWSFYLNQLGNGSGDVELVIGTIDPNSGLVVGPALYTSQAETLVGGQMSFNGINTLLGPGTYIAMITVDGVPNPYTYTNQPGAYTGAEFETSEGYYAASPSDGLPGGLLYSLSTSIPWGQATLSNGQVAWVAGSYTTESLVYSATFTASAVPETGSTTLVLSGLVAIFLVVFRANRRLSGD